MIISQAEGARHKGRGRHFVETGAFEMNGESELRKDEPRAAESLMKEEPSAVTTVPAVPRRVAARRLLRAEVFYALGLVAFAALALFAYFNAYFGWDLRVARAVQSVEAPWFAEFMLRASVFGNGWKPHVIAGVTAFVFLAFRRRSEAAGVALSAGGGALITNALKALIARPRPAAELVGFAYEGRGLSFPSGHVTFYVCYFGFLFFVAFALLPKGSTARRVACGLAALPVLLVGLSRIYLGAHWPSDTLGAYLWSGVWLAFSLVMYRRWKERMTFHKAELAKSAGQ
jgi:membrane-associated phospholipid phosphatase